MTVAKFFTAVGLAVFFGAAFLILLARAFGPHPKPYDPEEYDDDR